MSVVDVAFFYLVKVVIDAAHHHGTLLQRYDRAAGLPHIRKALMTHKRRLVALHSLQLPLLRIALGWETGSKVDPQSTRAQLRRIR